MQRRFPNFVKRLLSSHIFTAYSYFCSKIDLNQYLDRIEIADNNFTRQQGLMYRQAAGECRDVVLWQEHICNVCG